MSTTTWLGISQVRIRLNKARPHDNDAKPDSQPIDWPHDFGPYACLLSTLHRA
jgi:hypothetical protein